MIAFVIRRVAQTVLVGLGITVVVFFLLHLIPGDPARAILGPHGRPAAVAALHKQLGLDKPLAIQYLIFLGNLAHGDLGRSYYHGSSVVDLLLEGLAPTLALLSYAVLLTVIIGIPMALVSALNREKLSDHGVRALMVFMLSLPGFWLGILLIYFLAVVVPLFPVGGYGEDFGDHVRSLFLPALTLALTLIPIFVRALRGSLIESLRSDYVAMARAKGLPEHRVLVRHVLRSSLVPSVNALGVNVGFLIGGVVIIESVFGVPGVGSLITSAISTRDYPTIEGATLLFGILVVVVNLATDLLTLVLDPRARGT